MLIIQSRHPYAPAKIKDQKLEEKQAQGEIKKKGIFSKGTKRNCEQKTDMAQ